MNSFGVSGEDLVYWSVPGYPRKDFFLFPPSELLLPCQSATFNWQLMCGVDVFLLELVLVIGRGRFP